MSSFIGSWPSKPRLGVGVTTFNRHAALTNTLHAIKRLTRSDIHLVVADDGSSDGTVDIVREQGHACIAGRNRGIAWNKNRALFYLNNVQRCDVVILLEDDTRPVEAGWEQAWVDAALRWGHINFAGSWFADHSFGGVGSPADPLRSEVISGQCAAFSRVALETVGFMDTRFRRYGFEHAEHTERMVKAGFGGYIDPERAGKLIYYLLTSPLTVDSEGSGPDEQKLVENRAVYSAIRNDGIHRWAWRTDEELKIFWSELSQLAEAPPFEGSCPSRGTNQLTTETTTRNRIMSKLWHGQDPYAFFPLKLYGLDAGGWNSQHEYLRQTIAESRPEIIVEIGVWKGGSTLTMAQAMREAGIDGTIVAVDTWLGSWDHWHNPEWHSELCFEQGYPKLFHKFLSNVLSLGLQDFIVPFPLDSANAARVIGNYSLFPSLVHIDGAHDFDAVMQDIQRWWPLLSPGGWMICDDYDANKVVWPEVERAVATFLATTPHVAFEWSPYKCRFQKPGQLRSRCFANRE